METFFEFWLTYMAIGLMGVVLGWMGALASSMGYTQYLSIKYKTPKLDKRFRPLSLLHDLWKYYSKGIPL